MGPTHLAAQNHGKMMTSVFEMEEKGFALFHGSEIPPEHTGEIKTFLQALRVNICKTRSGLHVIYTSGDEIDIGISGLPETVDAR